MRTLRQVLPLLACGLLATLPGFAKPAMSADELSAFVHHYYQQPQPERITQAIASLGPSGYVQRNARGFVAFFAEVFSAHPEYSSRWGKAIKQQDRAVRDFLQQSLELSRAGGALSLEGHSAELNDIWWGAFFATGNPAFIRRLVAELRHSNERGDFGLFMAGATAKWSLLSNAESHLLVRQTLDEARLEADPETLEILAQMRIQKAEDVRREIRETVARQKAAGVWSH